MNKRIEELVVQASEYVNTVYTPPVRSKTGGRGFGKTAGKMWEDGHVGWHSQFNQKFAELIVRECIAQCNDGDSRHFISTHFGIEE